MQKYGDDNQGEIRPVVGVIRGKRFNLKPDVRPAPDAQVFTVRDLLTDQEQEALTNWPAAPASATPVPGGDALPQESDLRVSETLPAAGTQPSPKRCAICGRRETVLSWRPSSIQVAACPVRSGAWFPADPVREAKSFCPGCGFTSYAWLVNGRLDEQGQVDGVFVIAPLDFVARW